MGQNNEGLVCVSLWIEPHQRDAINRIATRRGLTQSSLMRPLFAEFLERSEIHFDPATICRECKGPIPDGEPVLHGLCLPCYAAGRKAELIKAANRGIPEPIVST